MKTTFDLFFSFNCENFRKKNTIFPYNLFIKFKCDLLKFVKKLFLRQKQRKKIIKFYLLKNLLFSLININKIKYKKWNANKIKKFPHIRKVNWRKFIVLKKAGTILGRPKEEYVRLTEKLEQIYWVNYRENAMHKIENLGKYGFVAQLSSGIIEFHIFASLNDIVKLPPDSISFVTVIGGEKKWYEENARKKKKSKGRLIPSPSEKTGN